MRVYVYVVVSLGATATKGEEMDGVEANPRDSDSRGRPNATIRIVLIKRIELELVFHIV